MGQKNLKASRRALRKTAKKEKNNIISHYMTDNWDKVLTSSVALIRQFSFKNRLSIAMTILFKPIRKPKSHYKVIDGKKVYVGPPSPFTGQPHGTKPAPVQA